MPIIPPDVIDEIRLGNDIVDIVSDYVALTKKGRNYFGLCPFHNEKTPSFSVNAEKQIFHCFGCGAGGNVFTFVQRQEGIGFVEAVRTLAKRAGVSIPEPRFAGQDVAESQHKEALYYANQFAAAFFQEMLFAASGAAALAYLRQRDFDEAVLRAFAVGYAPPEWEALATRSRQKQLKLETMVEAGLLGAREDGGFYDRFRNRIMFPIHNQSGRVVAFGGRRLGEEDSPKYINTSDTPIYQKGRFLYAWQAARDAAQASGRLIVVEGYTDAMRLHLAGLKNAVATAGTALTEHQARLMRRFVRGVALLYDSDTAGGAATLRGADILVENGLQVAVATLPAGEDPDSFVVKHGAGAIQKVVAGALPLLEFKIQNLAQNTEQMSSPVQRAEAVASIADTVARTTDAEERSRMVQHIARRLQLREEVLWAEISRVRAVRRQPGARKKAEVQEFALRSAAQLFAERCRETEGELLRIMILYPEAIAFIFSFMRVEDFHDQEMREMARVFAGLADKTATMEREDFLHHFAQPSHAEFVSRVVHQEAARAGVTPDYQRWAADCMANLQRLVVQERMRELQELIREREASGDDVTELNQQFNEYLDHLKRIRADNFLVVNDAENT